MRAGWRALTFLVVSLALAIVVGGIALQLFELTPIISWARLLRIPLDQLVVMSAFLGGTRISVRLFEPPGTPVWEPAGLGAGSWGTRPVLFGLAVGAGTLAVPSLLLVFLGRSHFAPSPDLTATWLSAARADVMLLIPAALAEEVVVRGYALTVLREGIGETRAIILTSVIFGLLHLFNPDPTAIATIAVALAGAFLATVRFATGSLVAAWAAHFAWNFMQAAVLHAPVSGISVSIPGYQLLDDGPAWLTGGSWGPEGGVAAAASLAIATFMLRRRQKRDDRRENETLDE